MLTGFETVKERMIGKLHAIEHDIIFTLGFELEIFKDQKGWFPLGKALKFINFYMGTHTDSNLNLSQLFAKKWSDVCKKISIDCMSRPFVFAISEQLYVCVLVYLSHLYMLEL